jgi:transposase
VFDFSKKAVKGGLSDAEKKLYQLRARVNRLFFEEGLSKNKISRQLGVSKKFVIHWTKSREQNFTEDQRGWKKDKGRKWTEQDRKRIAEIHDFLMKDPQEFFWGATAIVQEWRKRYPEQPAPSIRTVGEILARLGLSEKRKQKRVKGASRYLCYPEHTIYEGLGYRLLEADFIGKKFLGGRRAPLNFIGFSFKKIPRLRHFVRVNGETSTAFISSCGNFFERFEIPGAVKVDNCAAAIGSATGRRNLSRLMTFLLENHVVPIFSVPRKPFSQASIEGNNSVFSKKFWNRNRFGSIEEVDEKLKWFNEASQRYMQYSPPLVNRKTGNFTAKVFFIRQVLEAEDWSSRGVISVLNEKIELPASFVNYFVLAEWNLKKERLSILFENEKRSELIKQIDFAINFRRYRESQYRIEKIKKQIIKRTD